MIYYAPNESWTVKGGIEALKPGEELHFGPAWLTRTVVEIASRVGRNMGRVYRTSGVNGRTIVWRVS